MFDVIRFAAEMFAYLFLQCIPGACDTRPTPPWR